ncbi:MAG: YIP1 family protein [Pseudomonadota bacterium]
MYIQLLRLMAEGLFAPRTSARWILSGQNGLEVAVQFAVLAYCLQAMLAVVIPGARPVELTEDGIPIGSHVLNIIAQVALVGVLGLAVYGLGRLFGGEGTRDQALVITAWHTLVTTLLSPLFLLGASATRGGSPEDMPIGVVFIFAIGVSQYLWVLACYTMELHGFRNPWSVLGVMVAVALLFSTALISLGTTA